LKGRDAASIFGIIEKWGGSVFRLLLSFWRGDGRLPDEPEPPGEPKEQTPETSQPDDRAQSLIEYTILLTWLTLFFIGLVGLAGGGTKGIWNDARSNLSTANVVAGGS
jgi:Flp pilus assembly pilin Flp